MAEKKIIAVVGATGAQGGGLVRAILADPAGGFAARAITRDVGSEKARALAQAGAQSVHVAFELFALGVGPPFETERELLWSWFCDLAGDEALQLLQDLADVGNLLVAPLGE